MVQEENNDIKYHDQLCELRKNLETITTKEFSDAYLLRWMKASDYDILKAEYLIKKRLRSEQLIQMERIIKDFKLPEILKTCDFMSFMGFDKENDPILYINFGNRDEEGLLRTISSLDLILHKVFWRATLLEYQKDHCAKLGLKPSEVITVVADYENFTLQHATDKHAIQLNKEGMKILRLMDPGVVKRTLVINTSATFSILFAVIKPFTHSDMLKNTIMCSTESTPEELLKYIDADVLPVSFGGTKVDENGDPRCSSFLNYAGKISEEYFSINKPQLKFSDEGVEEITVPAWNSSDVLVYVEKPGSKIHVEFKSYEPIVFEILIRKIIDSEEDILEDLGEPEEIFGPVDVHSHLTPVDNILHASSTGIYVFRFNNTSNWIESKSVIYRIQVIPPKSDE